MAKLHSKYIYLTQLRLHYLEGEQRTSENIETIVFLHGFPQFSGAWRQQMQYFADTHRVIAPDLPGYNLSDKPEDPNFYRVENLISVMAEFIVEINNCKPVYLAAHDWGGAIAWPLAAFNSELIHKLIILNAAHPSTFTREILRNPIQQDKSAYISDLISENGVEIVSRNNFQYLRDLISVDGGKLPMSLDDWQAHIKGWLQPRAIASMLHYYRNMPLHQSNESARKIPNIRINVPTLVLWGINDSAFCPEVLDGLDEYVTQLRVVQFKEATHWLHHEIPELINKQIEKFIL